MTISTLASNIPANSQSSTEVFEDPTVGDNIPVDVVVKGASGLNAEARQQGANAFCKYKSFTQALPNFRYERDSTIGTMQWDRKTEDWVFCESCKSYLTRVTCKQ
ncbi:hypothetical protein [Kamptonema sp. PCC 6506]|uniref:hypothetical protein n=1 Tax=Kamptonema sp. PCC 6506 TaxID=272129 RepID=UPI0001DAC894|nr:hypothetical protein [Kamptonema sp. PCC 6506]CBN58013.1 hypothetical protein OSCI_3590046 [Kamptonema sp. PCC 6506]